MSNFSRLIIGLVGLSLFTVPIRHVSGDVIPKGLVQGDTLAVVYIDLTRADAAALRQTATAIVGEEAAQKAAWLVPILKHSEALAKAGVIGGGIVWSGPRGEDYPRVEMMAFLNLKPGVDAAMAARAVESHLPKANVIFAMSENELLFVPDRTNVPEEEQMKDHAKRAQFEKQLTNLGDAAFKLVVMSSDALAKQHERPEPKPNHEVSYSDGYLVTRALFHRLTSTNLFTIAARTGTAPAISAMIEAKTPKAALEFMDELRVTRIGVRGLRADSLHRMGYEEPNSFVLYPILAALHPDAKEKTVTVNLDVTVLKKLGLELLLGIEQKEEAYKELLCSIQIRQLINETMLYTFTGKDFPDSFEDLRDSVGSERLDFYLKHPRTGEKVGFRWIKPAATEKDMQDFTYMRTTAAQTVVVVELRDGKPVEGGWRGYLNGRTAKGPTAERK